MKVVDFDGTVLDATFSIRPPEDGVISLDYESAGGTPLGEHFQRNRDYRRGLNVLLQRLQLLSAVVPEIRIETGKARFLPIEEQRVFIPHRPFPVAMASVSDVNEFRQEISRYGREVGRAIATSRGGSSRRLRIFLSGVPTEQAELESRLAGRGTEPDASVIATVVNIAAGKSRVGRGLLVSQSVREVVEKYAVDWATRYYQGQGWTVEDVGATESFDLRCIRDGVSELHVEVKGTTGLGESVILTRNEVLHARELYPNVDLFIVTETRIEGRDGEHPSAYAGSAHIYREWQPAEEDLTSIGYEYCTDLCNQDGLASWIVVE